MNGCANADKAVPAHRRGESQNLRFNLLGGDVLNQQGPKK